MSTKIKFSFLVFLIAFNMISAQYGNQGMNGGMQRGAGSQNYPNEHNSKTPEQIQKERAEFITKTLEKLKKELTLDALQEIAIKNELIANFKEMDIVMKSESAQEDKITQIESASKRMDYNINSFLNTEQKEKYKKYVEEKDKKMERIKEKYR